MVQDQHQQEGQLQLKALGHAGLTLVEDMLCEPSIIGVCDRFQAFIEGLGFEGFSCFKIPDQAEPFENCLYLCTRPTAWVQHYVKQDYVRVDPLVKEALRTTRPYSWQDVLNRPTTESIGHHIQREREEFGAGTGIVVPIFESKGYAAIMAIAGRIDIGQESLAFLEAVSILIHNRVITLNRENHMRDDFLTTREAECLTWAAEGKSDWEIGQILQISPKTVNYHIENTKRKFGVPTRVQAITSAIRFGKL